MPSLPKLALALVVTAAVVGAAWCGLEWLAQPSAFSEHAEDDDARGPRLQIVTDEQDLGSLQPASVLHVSFCIANTGTQPLELRSISPQRPDDEDSVVLTVEPGRTGELVVQLNSDTLFPGGRHRVHLRTNDPARPDLHLTIRGTVAASTPPAESAPLRNLPENPQGP